MKLRSVSIALAISILPVVGHAQTIVEMDRFTCAQYLAMPPSLSRDFSAWMSGWFAYQERRTFVDLLMYQKNTESVKAWCRLRPQASVMEALKSSIGQ